MSLEYLKNKRILITGATGFVGQYLLRALQPCVEEHGTQITCLVRKSSNPKLIPDFAKTMVADFTTGAGLDEALEGQDMLLHVAAMLSGVFWQDYFCNVQAASLLGQAIDRHKLERVVLVSSISATGPITPYGKHDTPIPVDDNTPPHPVAAYGWSKYLAECALARHCDDKLVILRPPIIYGSGDKALLPYFQCAKMGLVVSPGMGRDFPVSTIHASDMAEAILCAMKPEAKGIYHCNDGVHEHKNNQTMKGLGMLIAEVMGKKAVCVKMPLWFLGLSALCSTAGGFVGSFFGMRMPSWTYDKFRESCATGFISNGKRLEDELGFRPKMSLRVGLQEAYTGYKKDGWL